MDVQNKSRTGGPAVNDLKLYHMQQIRNLLLREDSLTVREIARKTGLSIVTVGTLLQQMSENGELLPPQQTPSEGGRPAYCYSYDLSCAYALILNAFHIGNDANRVTVQVINLRGRIVHTDRHNMGDIDIGVLDSIIDDVLGKFPAIRTLGFVLPATVYAGFVTCGDFEALNGIDLRSHMMDRYGLPVYFDNDVNAAVRGFCSRWGLLDTTVVYLFFPQRFPPGAGVFVNGDVYSGTTNFVGELSFLPFDIDWKHATKKQLQEYLRQLVPTICCLYNPSSIVFNGKLIDEECLGAVEAYCMQRLPVSSLPELSISTDFIWDISEGSIAGVLGLLNRPESFHTDVQ